MRKFISILLTLSLLLQSLPVSASDMFQWDDLIEHARFHKEKYGDNFLTFLSKHYGELKDQHNKTHREEHNQHRSLPGAGIPFSLIVPCVIDFEYPDGAKIPISEKHKVQFYYFESVYEFAPAKRLQPPR